MADNSVEIISWMRMYKGRGMEAAKRSCMNRGDRDDRRGVAEDLLV